MQSHHPFLPTCNEAIFIGFAGRMGSGKTSAARYLSSKYAFQYVRYSQILQDWLSVNSTDRGRLQALGWDIMAGGKQAELNSRLIAALDTSRSAAIDGLRHPIDFESLSSSFNASFRMIFLKASQENRFERLRSRFPTLEEFQVVDSHPVEASIDGLQSLAYLTISTDRTLETLYNRLDACLLDCGLENQA